MAKVYNKTRRDAPPGAVYIGRPSKWGNPFTHYVGTLALHRVKTRAEAIAMYERYITVHNPDLLEAAKRELKGKDLVCWCSPLPCHGDVLLKIANGEGNET